MAFRFVFYLWYSIVEISEVSHLFLLKKKTAYVPLFISLVILGYFCLILLSEAQDRYKCLVEPFVFIFIACSFSSTSEKKGIVFSDSACYNADEDKGKST